MSIGPLEALTFTSIDDFNGPYVLSVPVPNAKGDVTLKLIMGNKGGIVNGSDKAVTIKRGAALFGFGKVTWKKVQVGDDKNLDDELVVKFESSADHVVLGGALVSLYDAVNDRRKTQPSVSVCYHALEEDPESDKPGAFKLSMKHEAPMLAISFPSTGHRT